MLVAEPLRNTGRFTMADVLSFRLKQRPVRTAAAVTTLAVSIFYLIAQMAGAGGLVALLLGLKGKTAQSIVVAIVGVLMIAYVLIGGMKGTTYVQMIKAYCSLVVRSSSPCSPSSRSRVASMQYWKQPPRSTRRATRS